MKVRWLIRRFTRYVLVGGLAFVVDFRALFLLAYKAGFN